MKLDRTQQSSCRDVLLTKHEAFHLMMFIESWNGEIPIPCILKPEPMWSGKSEDDFVCGIFC